MKKKNLKILNNIQNKHIDKNILKRFSRKFKFINDNFLATQNQSNKLLNLLRKDSKFNFNIKNLKRFKKYKTIAIIGMGGSILGAKAIKYSLQKRIKKDFYFFDNIDTEKIINFRKKKNLDKILFIVISKSGNTIETLSNCFYLKIFKKNKKNIIIISERNKSFLHLISQKLNLFFIEHKDYIGGRYSVLSEVGLVPAYLMDLNIKNFKKNLKNNFLNQQKNSLREISVTLANLLLKKKKTNLIFLNYVPQLEKFLFWLQQLIAESLGKDNKGFLPVISNVPRDHHSMLQLYLDGPKDKIFYIFSFDDNVKTKIKSNYFLNKKNFLNNKNLSDIKNAQKNAVIKTFKKNKIPFREFSLGKINEEVLGELFSLFIIETIIIGKLAGLDPFNQPAVEQVKIFTNKSLKK